MWAFITAVVPLILLLFQEFFSAKAKAAEADKKFELDEAKFKTLVDAAMKKWIAKNAKDSAGISSGWDSADGEAKKATRRKK